MKKGSGTLPLKGNEELCSQYGGVWGKLTTFSMPGEKWHVARKKCEFWWPCDLCRNVTLACNKLCIVVGRMHSAGDVGSKAKRKKYSSGTRGNQHGGRGKTRSGSCFCMAMLPRARNSLIWPEIILIFVEFDCGLTTVKYPFPKWYLENLVPQRSKQSTVVPLALKHYFQLLIAISEPSVSLSLASVIGKLISPPNAWVVVSAPVLSSWPQW